MSERKIKDAIATLYAQTRVPPPAPGTERGTALGTPLGTSPVAPLGELLGELPLYCAEIGGLSRGKAIAHLQQRTGATLPAPPAPEEHLSGFLYGFSYQGEVWGCLLVEAEDIVERRRFSAAHELGHYLLHFQPLLRRELRQDHHLFLSEGFSYEAPPGGEAEEALPGPALLAAQDMSGVSLRDLLDGAQALEAEANRFAAELLMPEALCRALWAAPRDLRTPRRLAQEFMVSPAAMQARLGALGLWH